MNVEALLSRLEDPLETLAIETISRKLGDLVTKSDEALAETTGWSGIARKYYSVEQEHHVEEASHLIGSVFVLGQTAITDAVAIAVKIRKLAGQPSWLPENKSQVLQIANAIDKRTGSSEIAIIDAIANYFKHHREWPEGWNCDQGTHAQRRTIDLVRSLGFSPGRRDENLSAALQHLGFSTTELASVGDRIQRWRAYLARVLRIRLRGPQRP